MRAGATQIQGNYLGLGERCGDVQLSVVIPNLQLKSGYSCIPNSKMELVTRVASFIAETANINIPANMPYLGRNAFAQMCIRDRYRRCHHRRLELGPGGAGAPLRQPGGKHPDDL